MTCSIDMRFAPEGIDQAVQLLVSVVGPTEAASDCKKCSVARDAVEKEIVHYNEAWGSEAAFRQHLQSEVFRRVLTAMDMCCEEPQVTIGSLSGRRGIAYMQELREQK